LVAAGLRFGLILAADEDTENSSKVWYERIDSEWGGHLRASGSFSWHQQDSFYLIEGENPFADGFFETRLKNKTFWRDWFYSDIHYELVLSGFDTRAAEEGSRSKFGGLEGAFSRTGRVSDDRRLFDLTAEISGENSYTLYHRLDRASMSISGSWGLVRLGRQAITWGNGYLFNPMDLFNPFAPSDIIRDYKIGDDMAVFQTYISELGELQLLYVPRKNPATNKVEWDSSSLGGKLHLAKGTIEFDVMGARHYDDCVVGVGGRGYLGGASWRTDATYTFLEGPGRDRNGFLSFVANADYAWVWEERNFYGLVEFYYNGLGKSDYGSAIFDRELVDRVARGELFALAKFYLAGRINVEVHPLVNVYATAINNLQDPSGFIQPYAVADLTQNLQLTVGFSVPYGEIGTEYGGFFIPGTDYLLDSDESIYFWLTYYY
jgi:hypothetical protein